MGGGLKVREDTTAPSGGGRIVRKDDGTIGWWSYNKEGQLAPSEWWSEVRKGRRHPVSGGRTYSEAMSSPRVIIALYGGNWTAEL